MQPSACKAEQAAFCGVPNFGNLSGPVDGRPIGISSPPFEAEDVWPKLRYFDAPDLSHVGRNGYRFINAVSDFATHADPIRKTKSYNENLFLRTVEGNPMIDKAYKMVLAVA